MELKLVRANLHEHVYAQQIFDHLGNIENIGEVEFEFGFEEVRVIDPRPSTFRPLSSPTYMN